MQVIYITFYIRINKKYIYKVIEIAYIDLHTFKNIGYGGMKNARKRNREETC